MLLTPETQATGSGPGTVKVVVNKISRGKKGLYGPTVRMDVTVATGNDPEANHGAHDFLCSTSNSVEPESGEEVSGKGGRMLSENPPLTLGTNRTYHCTFDVESLHDHGWLVLGPYELKVDYPYDLR
ncbi:hypothetical protein GCM10009754_88380 [Amycolatopsis minnesotensis]|uniref:Uncharacterized protein n=1 Tax=Amycolatopsis minnesotensis TaxID=337894 RepID=A0ABP5EDE7_9PSEU